MTIPADIMKAARAVLTAPKHATRPHTELLLRIAGAIEDERKRCAESIKVVFERHDGSLSIAGEMALEAIEP